MIYNKEEVSVNDAILNGVINILDNNATGEWQGTMTKLGNALKRVLPKNERMLLPSSPSNLRVSLNKVVNRLRNRRVSVRFERTAKTRLVSFCKTR